MRWGMTRSLTRAWFIAAVLSGAAFGQDAPKSTPKPDSKPAKAEPGDADLERRAIDALMRREWDTAEKLLQRQIELRQGGFVPYYNMACCQSMKGDADAGLDWLTKSIERGFADMFQMRRDGYLVAVRKLDGYKKLADAWPQFLDVRIEKDIENAKAKFEKNLLVRKDSELRLAYVSGYDEKTTAQAADEVSLVAKWAFGGVFHGLKDAGETEKDAWVTVVLPKRDAYMKWLVDENGPDAVTGFSAIGGAYGHDDKRLVSQDLGATLRHEFLHALHWRQMTRRGFVQAIWIQEGLCSLVEDFDIVDKPGGKTIKVAESWRTNIAKRRERGGGLVPIEQFVKLSHDKFTNSTPLANYAEARTIFLWLEREGKLVEWYDMYMSGQDPTGLAALEQVMGAKGPDLHKKFRAFVRALPEVPETIEPGKASLGIEVEAGAGDGLSVTGIVGPPGRKPRVLTGENGEIRVGDVVRSIDGRPVRELAEMVRVLGSYEPGATVELDIRRGKSSVTVRVKLVSKGR